MLKACIEKLIQREDLTPDEAENAIVEIVRQGNEHQAAAFLVLLRAKGETADEISGLVNGMKHFMIPVKADSPVLDIVGTGGDGAKTVNISTGASLLAASCGVKIGKHGNRSVSSLCGSADVLKEMGIAVGLSSEKVKENIEEKGFGFMFAPKYHPAMKRLVPVRQALKLRTAFNLLGPLLNPAKAEYQMIGVYDEKLLELMAGVLFKLGTKRSFIFHGCGLDELSCAGPSKVIEVTEKGLRHFTIDPNEFGLPKCSVEDLKGGDAKVNGKILRDVFKGKEGPVADTLVLNAGVAIYLYGLAETIQQGIDQARQSLKSGKALEFLENLC